MVTIEDTFRQLNDLHNINFSVFYDAFDRMSLWDGVVTTLQIIGLSLIGSFVVGVLLAWLQGSRIKLVSGVTTGLVEFIRNTPPLAQLYFFYFGLGPLITTIDPASGLAQPVIGAFLWAIIGLSLYEGVFHAEALRAGIDAVPKTTLEACESQGMSRLQTYRLVVLPLSIRTSFPVLVNNMVNLTKSSTLAYAIGIPEILSVCSQIWADKLNVLELMVVLLSFFLLLIAVLNIFSNMIEKRLRIPGFGRSQERRP